MTVKLDSLYFHTFQPHDLTMIRWQGDVQAKVTDDVYLVRLYSFIDGCPSHLRLVALTEMLTWRFYEDSEALDEAFARWEEIKGQQ